MGPNVSTAAATAVSGAANEPSPFSSNAATGTARSGQFRAEDGHRGGDNANVDRAHHNQREPRGPSEIAPGVPELPGQVGDGFPAGEAEEQQARGAADRPVAVRGEGLEIFRLGVRCREHDGEREQCHQQHHERQLHAAGNPDADGVAREGGQQDHCRREDCGVPAAADGVGDVVAADHGRCRGAEGDRKVEEVPGHHRGAAPKGTLDEVGDPAGVGLLAAHFGEAEGDGNAEHQQDGPGQERRRAGLLGCDGGKHQDTRAQDRARHRFRWPGTGPVRCRCCRCRHSVC